MYNRYEWGDYCKGVAKEFGNKIYYYQISNEENHFVHEVFPDGDEAPYFQACYDGLKTGESASDPTTTKFKTIMNVFVGNQDIWGDVGYLRRWLNALQQLYGNTNAINIVAIDHYPSIWSGQSHTHWDELYDSNPTTDDLVKIMLDYNKEGAIMEFGFSSPPNCAGSEEFIDSAIPIIRSMVSAHNNLYPNNKILMASWFELVDSNTRSAWFCSPYADMSAYEDNFGVMQSFWNNDWPKEEGFNHLYYQFTNFPPPL